MERKGTTRQIPAPLTFVNSSIQGEAIVEAV